MDAETTSAGDLGNEGRKGASFALGTVQLGLPYGAANVTGMPSEEQAVAIVCEAVAAGVQSLDTAHGYELSQVSKSAPTCSLHCWLFKDHMEVDPRRSWTLCV